VDGVRRFRDHALALADESRRMLRGFVTSGFRVKQKSDGSYVTNADVEVERRLREMTAQAFPDHGLVGEEHAATSGSAGLRWVFDPIDGTEDFVHRVPTFGTIIALYRGDQPIVGVLDCPLLDLRVHGALGLGAYQGDTRIALGDVDPALPREAWRITMSSRANFSRHREVLGRDDGVIFDRIAAAFPNQRIYRSCLAHLLAVTGQAEACVDAHNPIWDIAAARILAEEAGGVCRTVQRYQADGEPMYSTVFGRKMAVEEVGKLFG
jgi:fructose-1,6-bisphosphatase/inositol monophosphatase family enzyme